jgi:hypothetical protein
MNKITTPALSTEFQAALDAQVARATKSAMPPSTDAKPQRVSICEYSPTAFAQAAILARQGYDFCGVNPPMTFTNGQASINMVLRIGNDDAGMVAAAAESVAIGLSREMAQAERDEAAALALTEEQQKRDAAKAVLALELAAAKALVQKLSAQTA